MLLQNATAILLQNATEVYYKMRQAFDYKMQQLLQNVAILLQNPTFITNCDSTRHLFKKWIFIAVKFLFISFIVTKRYTVFYPSFIFDSKFLCFIIFHFFQLNQHLLLNL